MFRSFAVPVLLSLLMAGSALGQGEVVQPLWLDICTSDSSLAAEQARFNGLASKNGLKEPVYVTLEAPAFDNAAEGKLNRDVVEKACDLVFDVNSGSPEAAWLVISAPDGPVRGTREALQLAKVAPVRIAGVLFTGTDVMSDLELLQLMRLEAVELVADSGLGGDAMPFFSCAETCAPLEPVP